MNNYTGRTIKPSRPIDASTREVQSLSFKFDDGARAILAPGSIVFDDLTWKNTRIKKIMKDEIGNEGIWLDDPYLDGLRFPWEISSPENETLIAFRRHK